MNTVPRRTRGFTLVEVVIVLAVVAILAAAITPALLQQAIERKVDATRGEMRLLHEAIAGRADVPGSFGFVGDMGRLPVTFDELLRPEPGTPLFTTATFRNVGMGWKGPYVNTGDSKTDVLFDAFNRPYEGASTGQVRSAGPDGVAGTGDDLVYPPNPAVVRGRVIVTLKRMAAEDLSYTVDPPGYEVRLYYSDGGREQFLADNLAPFVFENIPQGIHALQVVRLKDAQMVLQDTVQTFGAGATRLLELAFRL
jgi:prepilin-type N-terminal cleavage/methylation domain-containing protein